MKDKKGGIKMTLKDAVLFVYKKGLFTVEDSENYGCTGIYCENHGIVPNGFYCFSDSDEYIDKNDFLFHHTEEEIAEAITETIQDFINDVSFPEEAGCYLYDIERVCKENGKTEYLEVVQEWIEKAEKIVEDEMRR